MIPSKPLSPLPFFRLGLGFGMGPNHQLTIGNLTPPPLSRQMPQVTDAQGLGVPHDKAIASSGHCREAAPLFLSPLPLNTLKHLDRQWFKFFPADPV